MTDKEIIKALNKADGLEHVGIHCGNKKGEYIGLVKVRDIVDLINRQKAEIERLQKENEQFADIGKMYSEIKAEAVKEFAERLKKKADYYYLGNIELLAYRITADDIDNLVEEMVRGE